MKLKPKTIVLLVSIALFLVILLQNSDRAEVDILFWNDVLEMPLFVLIGVTLLMGWTGGWFTRIAYGRKKREKAKPQPKAEPKAEKIADIEAGKAEGSAEKTVWVAPKTFLSKYDYTHS